jgi:hypothetical protein
MVHGEWSMGKNAREPVFNYLAAIDKTAKIGFSTKKLAKMVIFIKNNFLIFNKIRRLLQTKKPGFFMHTGFLGWGASDF